MNNVEKVEDPGFEKDLLEFLEEEYVVDNNIGYQSEVNLEGIKEYKCELWKTSTGRVITQSEIFAINPKEKREYSRISSKRTRDKQKEEKLLLVAKNDKLILERKVLTEKINSLHAEINSLSKRNFINFRFEDFVEHELLKPELIKQKLLVQQLNDVLNRIDSNCLKDSSDESSVSSSHNSFNERKGIPFYLDKEGAKEAFKECRNLWANAIKPIHEINVLEQYPGIVDILRNTKHFANLSRILVSHSLSPEGSLFEDATELTFKVDISGVDSTKDALTDAILESFSYLSDDAVFWKLKKLQQEKLGVNFDVDRLDFSSLSISGDTDRFCKAPKTKSDDGRWKRLGCWHHMGEDKYVVAHRVKDPSENNLLDSKISVCYYSNEMLPKEVFCTTKSVGDDVEASVFCDYLFTNAIFGSVSRLENMDLERPVLRGLAIFGDSESNTCSVSIVGRICLIKQNDAILDMAIKTLMKLAGCNVPNVGDQETHNESSMLLFTLSAFDQILDSRVNSTTNSEVLQS